MIEMVPDAFGILFIVYNRWGEEVFRTENISDCWDGTFKGEALTPDVFAYYLEVYCPDDVYVAQGDVTLLR